MHIVFQLDPFITIFIKKRGLKTEIMQKIARHETKKKENREKREVSNIM